MATTYENMVLREMHRHEHTSKKEWGKQHAADSTVFGLETSEFARLEGLKEKVADLCDLQPTPAAMVRPPRKVCVRAPRTACARVHAPMASNNEPAAYVSRLRAPPSSCAAMRRCAHVSDRCSPRVRALSLLKFACTQEALKNLRDELAKSLSDVEGQLDELGGSASTVTARSMSQKSVKSTKSLRSVKAPSTVAEEDED